MKNWAENLEWSPNKIQSPSTEEGIQQVIQTAINENRKVRIIGTGHSFTSLCETKEVLLDLNNYQGLVDIDPVAQTATVKAGTKLKLLGNLLYEKGFSQENLGDIDSQSIAGSISTGTHGTGIEFGNISTQICAIRFINGKGEIVQCSENDQPALFKAMQISLGCLGVITQLTLKLVSAYKLELIKDKGNINETLANLEKLNNENRNFEFYWMPYTKTTQTKIINISTELTSKVGGFKNYIDEVFLENHMFKVFCNLAKWLPSLNNQIVNLLSAFISYNKKIHHSHQVYATVRIVKFYEMEYNVPYDAYQDVMKDLIKCVNGNKFNVIFPIENRFVQGDDIFLSPAYKRKSAYIAAHVYKGKDHTKYFNALEEIFVAYGGRPHWGKMHTRDANYFSNNYPEWEQFNKLRLDQDPNGLFISPYMKNILGC